MVLISRLKKMDNAFHRVKTTFYHLRDVLKCQNCLQLKKEDVVFFFRFCDHFYCDDCIGDSKSCLLCENKLDEPRKVVTDKHILSLYQSLFNFQLPSKEDVEKIYGSYKLSKENKCTNESREYALEKIIQNANSHEKSTTKNIQQQIENNKTEKTEVDGMLDRKKKYITPRKNEKIKMAESTKGSKKSTPVAKININKRNPKGETLLHIACKKSNFQEMEELIAAGANPNAQDNAGWTPLHDSVFSGNVEVIQFLLDHGAKVNAPGMENTTALHEAVAKGNFKIVKLLLDYGANPKAMNIFRESPLDLVFKYQFEEMKEILLEKSNNADDDLKATVEEANKNIVIYKHDLSVEDEKLVNKFVKKFNLEVINDVTTKTFPTHIVVAGNEVALNWSLISCIPSGCWIASIQWVVASLDQDTLKSAGQYEPSNSFLNGFSKARANKFNQLPGLFSGCHFFFGGNFEFYNIKNLIIKKEDLKVIVESQGGITLKRCPDPESLTLEKTLPYHASASNPLRDTSYYIIYQTEKWDPKPKYNMYHMKTLSIEWLLSCLFHFELVDPKDKELAICNFL